jgi:hypothetical protein
MNVAMHFCNNVGAFVRARRMARIAKMAKTPTYISSLPYVMRPCRLNALPESLRRNEEYYDESSSMLRVFHSRRTPHAQCPHSLRTISGAPRNPIPLIFPLQTCLSLCFGRGISVSSPGGHNTRLGIPPLLCTYLPFLMEGII